MATKVLQDKTAVIFGAAGSIGAAVAKEFASEGAEVFLAGRNRANVEAVAQRIVASGGKAHAAVVNSRDDEEVTAYFDEVVRQAGALDVVLDVSGPLAGEYGNGKNAVELSVEEFMVPLDSMVRSRFITARGAARHMIRGHYSGGHAAAC